MTNTENVTVTSAASLAHIDQSFIGQYVAHAFFLIAAQMGEVTEPVLDTENPNPDFMFTEDVQAWDDEMREHYERETEREEEMMRHEHDWRWNER